MCSYLSGNIGLSASHLAAALVIGVNPVLLSAIIYFVSVLLPQPLRSWIEAAVFNEANFIFWTALYIYVSHQIRHQRLDFNQTTNR